MNSSRTDEFLEKVVSQVKFILDRDKIRLELNDHIMNNVEYYTQSGYDLIDAERFALKDMGDPKEIGVLLNKEHNPIIGWIWKFSQIAVVILLVLNILFVGIGNLSSLFIDNRPAEIPAKDIVYKVVVDEEVRIDDRKITVKELIYDKNGNMNIFYEDYEVAKLGLGWSFGDIGLIKDNLNNEYISYSIYSGGGIVSKSQKIVENFSEEADTLIIEYDKFNRKYTMEIPLKPGDNND